MTEEFRDRGKVNSVNCKSFPHVKVTSFPRKPMKFFKESKEVGTIRHLYESEEYVFDDRSGLPLLNSDLCEYKKNGNKANIKEYLGHNMVEGFETFEPISGAVLEDMAGVFQFIKRCETKQGKFFNKNSKFTVVSARHHLIDLIMCPFSREDVYLIVTFVDGYLFFSADHQNSKIDMGIHSKDLNMRRICYTGFELENLVTKTPADNRRSCFFSMIEGKVDDNISILLKAEMDCQDESEDTYTEIKCSTNFKLKNQYHRRKLLRMWVQTSLIPHTDLLIGFRDPYYNQLSALESYTRDELYRKFNNKNLKIDNKHFNYNANISVQWFHHVLGNLCDLVEANVVDKKNSMFQGSLVKRFAFKLANYPQNTQRCCTVTAFEYTLHVMINIKRNNCI